VAEIIVPPSGPSMIRRLTAAVVVRLDRVPIGIAAKPLDDGTEIEFSGCRLTFRIDDGGEAMATPAADVAEADDCPAPSAKTRLVNPRTGESVDLGDARIVVGRDQACDFVVSGKGVSRRHFSITPVQGGYLLRDESANGTVVNGSPVSGTYLLGHGDVVRVDEEELRFEAEGVVSSPPGTTAEPTAILDVSRLRSEFAESGQRERDKAHLAANLEIVRGPYAGASLSVDRPVCAIGRGPQSDVMIRDESVSANHATLLRKGTSWFVVDLRSANGTFVDGLRIAGEREITSGSRLTLGRVELVFRALDSSADAGSAMKRKRSWLRDLLRPRRGNPA
jgi:pSer/pThr/pTyr-binding forkhead associated (FHA) protein